MQGEFARAARTVLRNESKASGVVSDIRRARSAQMARRGVLEWPVGTAQERPCNRRAEHLIIKEIQAAVARELARTSEVPKTMPKRTADLLRELHRRLREQTYER